MDPSRRSVIGSALFSVALTVPNWPDVVGRIEAVQAGTRTRLGMSDVETVIAMTEQLSSRENRQADDGHVHSLIGPHLKNHDAQALYERARATVRPELIPA
ncbi:hypothetical protein GA0115259_101149 [Streptomyces sp. MnatMP-M17]|nr:hypothetical protein GA0115259_101149 [Streptomyces sp. MnatMP-M17]